MKYDLIIYGNAHKRSFEKLDQAQRLFLKAIFFIRKCDSLKDVVQNKKKF